MAATLQGCNGRERRDFEACCQPRGIAGSLSQVTRDDIVSRAIGHFRSADSDYGARVEAAVKAARAK
jgi:catalase